MRSWMVASIFALYTPVLIAQEIEVQTEKVELDSIYISETEEFEGPVKILHAEPLYIDLIRDLGARRGEKEWNFGFGLTDRLRFDRYSALVEYEFAPVNRLGLEIEVPVSFYIPQKKESRDSMPSARVESLKIAAQWTFLVSDNAKTSLALGYINELLISDIRGFSIRKPLMGNVFNPFFIAAKRWGNNFHTLLYTGPHIMLPFYERHVHASWNINTNFHYMIRGTRNFIGIEFNKEVWKGTFSMHIRPQLRLGITDKMLIGLVAGIPVSKHSERFSVFTRLIYEPSHRNKHARSRSNKH